MNPFAHKEITNEFGKQLAKKIPELIHEIADDMKAYAIDNVDEDYGECLDLITRLSKCYELQISNII